MHHSASVTVTASLPRRAVHVAKMSAATNLPPISPERSVVVERPHPDRKRGSSRNLSVQFKRAVLPQRNVHIKTLDNKLVCYTPTSPAYERRRSHYPEVHEPMIRKSNVQWSYKHHGEHPNMATAPTRYSANRNRKPASGIVPMPPKWIEMTEQLKKDQVKPMKKTRRKSEGGQSDTRQERLSVTFKEPVQPEEMNIRTLSISEARKSIPAEDPLAAKTPYRQMLPAIPEADAKRRELRKPKNKMTPNDRAEMFIMYTPPSKWQSHWIGPM